MNNNTDHRLVALYAWLKQEIPEPFQCEVASSDASFRRYFRISTAEVSYIAMDAPPDKEDCAPFIRVSQLFSTAGMNIPQIYAQDLKQGFLLLTDFGSKPCLSLLNEGTADRLYQQAMHSLCSLQSFSLGKSQVLPLYSADKLLDEMRLFEVWFIERLLGITVTASIKGLLHTLYQRLLESAAQQPYAWVHRDYHSRNLMVTPQNNLGIIDFQDAVYGPVTYDLVSLLRDSYIRWPVERVRCWSEEYFTAAQEAGIISQQVSLDQWQQWFDWMGMQRQLKVLGIFSRLKLRDYKLDYIKDLPLTFDYLLATAKAYPEFNALAYWLGHEVKPPLDVFLRTGI